MDKELSALERRFASNPLDINAARKLLDAYRRLGKDTGEMELRLKYLQGEVSWERICAASTLGHIAARRLCKRRLITHEELITNLEPYISLMSGAEISSVIYSWLSGGHVFEHNAERRHIDAIFLDNIANIREVMRVFYEIYSYDYDSENDRNFSYILYYAAFSRLHILEGRDVSEIAIEMQGLSQAISYANRFLFDDDNSISRAFNSISRAFKSSMCREQQMFSLAAQLVKEKTDA